MATNLLDDTVLSQIVAGTLPLAGGDPLASVALVVRDLLGTDAVHTVVAADKLARRVHYFAVPSAALHSVSNPSLPLTAALPGHPAHRGDGVYLLHGTGLTAAAVLRAGELRLYVNEPLLVDGIVADSGVPAYEVDALDNGWPLVSRRGEIQRVADRASLFAARGAGALALLAGLAYAGTLAAGAWIESGDTAAGRNPQQQQAVLRDALRSVQLASPLSEQLSRLQAVAATAVRAGGWIDMYQLERGREHFRVVLPEWVTRDYVTALGADLKADLNGDGTVQVVKGSPGRDGKPESARKGADAAPAATPAPAAPPAAPAPNQAPAR